jgi:tyrosine-protein kinase Etk/Wzc
MTEEMAMNKDASLQERENFDGGDSIGLLDLAIALAKNKKKIIIFTVVVMAVVAGLTLLIPDRYTARAQILPPQSQSGSSALLGQLGSLTGLSGGALKNPNDTYIGMLNSRTVADNLIAQFKLAQVYDKKRNSDTRLELQNSSSILSSKENVIMIDVTDKDPKLAADLANAYVTELQKLTSTVAVTEAARRRLFFEKQLQKTKNDLLQAEVNMRQTQEKTGLIRPNEQAEGVIKAAASIKAEIAAKEVELGALRTFATTSNPEVQRAQSELAGLRTQLSKIERGPGAGQGDISVAIRAIPEVGLEYIRNMRELKYQETLLELFAKQFELAKVDEAKEGALVQVLDVAVVPDKKASPKRSLLVFLSGIIAFVLALVYVFFGEIKDKMKSNPENASRLAVLAQYRKWR